jgi:hypothetical protein
MVFCLPILVPGVIAMDNLTLPRPPEFHATTSLVVHAPPETVRRAILRDGVLKPDGLLSFGGTNQLLAWRWQRKGDALMRICSYSIGPDIVQPIDESTANHIKFSVNAAPPPMRETSPFGQIKPLHIENHYMVRSGEFTFVPVRGGTQLIASTEYSHDIWPLEYWALWSDFIMHRVHSNLLERVKLIAENSPEASR